MANGTAVCLETRSTVFISDYLYTLSLFKIKLAKIQIFQNGLSFSPFFSDKAQKNPPYFEMDFCVNNKKRGRALF